MSLKIVGLGFGEPNAITLEAIETIKKADKVLLRTKFHPTVSLLDGMNIKYDTCDELYDKANSFEELYEDIAEKVISESKHIDLVYVVPGAPSVLESTVNKLLLKCENIEIIEAVSFIEPCVTASKIDVGCGFVMIDALDVRFSNINPNFNIMITQLWNEFLISDVKLKLMEIYNPETIVTAIYSAGIKDEEKIKRVKIYEMDRLLKPDIRLSVIIETQKNLNIFDSLNKLKDKNIDEIKKVCVEENDYELYDALFSIIEQYQRIERLLDEGFYEKSDVINALNMMITTKKFLKN